MAIKQIHSEKSQDHIITDLKTQIGSLKSELVIYFASSSFDQVKLAQEMNDAFKGATVFGCSTAGEIVTGKMMSNSVVALCFDKDSIEDISVQVVENIKSQNQIPEAFKNFESHFKTPMMNLDVNKYVGIILVDGLSGAEEKLMDKIGDLTNIVFIGGSAGDDLKFKQTFVSAQGKAMSNAAILAVIKPTKGFDIIKTQSFCSMNKPLKATEVDEASRKVIKFNNKPAAEAYSEVLNIAVADASNKFMTNPVGLMSGEEIFVRSPQQIQDGSMIFYCNIKQDMELQVLSSQNIIEDTTKAVEAKKKELGNLAGIIDFHCILRTLELRQKNLCNEYGRIFNGIPMVGFSTYGEEYLGHINQTSTMLVFK